LLETVGTFASDAANGITQMYVTGHSLGGAAANILRNVADDDYGGFYDDATYFTLATPKVSADPRIFNVGFENDWVFKAISRVTPFVESDFFSTTDNFILYDDAYADPDFPGWLFDPTDTTAHDGSGYVEAIQRVTESHFYEDMHRDSLVIVVGTDEQVSNKETSTADQFGESAFFVGRDTNDDILGGPLVDFIDGGDGNDTIAGGGGADRLNGGDTATTCFSARPAT
jgi:Ca2+-binding RTX toxin-like protein